MKRFTHFASLDLTIEDFDSWLHATCCDVYFFLFYTSICFFSCEGFLGSVIPINGSLDRVVSRLYRQAFVLARQYLVMILIPTWLIVSL